MSGMLYWLYPGLKIKRWLLLAFCGLGAAFLGFLLLTGPAVFQFLQARLPLAGAYPYLLYGILLLCGGLPALFYGLYRALRAAKEALLFKSRHSLVEMIFTRRYLADGPRLVAIGGGTGLSTLLRELKNYTSNLTAVVTVADDGGSSGRLRHELGILPPGDIRACILAMADTEPLMEMLFNHRFTGGEGLAGHNFGNLFIAAMTEMFGFQEAVKFFGKVLAIRGQVYPVTLDLVQLESVDERGEKILGESVHSSRGGFLKRVALRPTEAKPLPEVLRAIADADAIILGPGSLFTSVLPNLLVPGVVEALLSSPAPVFYICNVMTQPGETAGFSASDHLRALLEHTSPQLVDYVVVNSDLAISPAELAPYRERGADLVRPDYENLRKLVPRIISYPLINRSMLSRHHGPSLARLLMGHIPAGMKRGWNAWESRFFSRSFPRA
ncbi:MAG: YvcK family protein [Firmicutes bacterium]|jgi:uncharacterized cofD-like protein|nr:YvcK family protein [Bacillota bacterium]HPU00376.1 YvcK family protein [Bacillota bacterium]